MGPATFSRQMVLDFTEVIIQISSIGLVIAAAGLWTGTGGRTRPKRRDEQTLIGGTIWSQIIIPIGLMISKMVQETVDLTVVSYYLLTGIFLLWVTGIVLIVHETKRYRRRKQRIRARLTREPVLLAQAAQDLIDTPTYDKAYYGIGVLCFIAGALKMTEFIMFVILAR